MTVSVRRISIGSVVLVAGALALAWFAYAPALGAAFGLDDVANLGELASVDDRHSALRFVFSGNAGPLGRPIALASFLPQADALADGAGEFLVVNVFIHLLNGALLAAALALLSRTRGLEPRRAAIAAVGATAVWLFLPVLAPASLNVVQRMTTLSATFVLLGLLGYLLARRELGNRPVRALGGMSAALFLGTALAAFTKENGALLPTFVLVVESTLLARPRLPDPRLWRAWSALFLWLPTAMIAGYLAMRVPYSEALVLKRDFTAWQRLMTEARILWEYLAKAFVPLPGTILGFYDDQPVARSLLAPLTLLAVSSWLAIAALAIAWRRRYPLAAFAALWYLAGHAVESTVLPLELYFDHRNYLPLVGPVYALAAGVAALPARSLGPGTAALAAYALALAAGLHSLGSLWGQPAEAARYWHEQAPLSMRAATTHATRQIEAGQAAEALEMIQRFVIANPEHAYVLIQFVNMDCLSAPDVDRRRQVEAVKTALGSVRFTYTVMEMLAELLATTNRADCRGIDSATVRGLAEALADNPRYAGDPRFLNLYHKLVALTHFREGDSERALAELQKVPEGAMQGDLTTMKVMVLADLGRFDAALAVVRDAHDRLPLHPMRRRLLRRDLDELEQYIATVRGATAASGSGAPPDPAITPGDTRDRR